MATSERRKVVVDVKPLRGYAAVARDREIGHLSVNVRRAGRTRSSRDAKIIGAASLWAPDVDTMKRLLFTPVSAKCDVDHQADRVDTRRAVLSASAEAATRAAHRLGKSSS